MADGLDGLSAYELARAAGFRGTAQEWLASLAGPRGKDGRDGKDADPAVTAELVRRAVAEIPRPADGKDADPALIADMVRRAVAEIPKQADGKDATPSPAVPWFAAFEFDDLDRTTRIEVTASNPSGRQPWEIVPIRDVLGRAVAATINPLL